MCFIWHIHQPWPERLPRLPWEYMEGITVHIGWEYFLGLLGALVAVAWYSNGRFTALETSMDWVKNMLLDLKKAVDDGNAKSHGETPKGHAQEHDALKQQTLW